MGQPQSCAKLLRRETVAGAGAMAFSGIHQKCRNGNYPKADKIVRLTVPDNLVSWSVAFPLYNPVEFTSPHVLTAPWADPDIKDPNFHPKFNLVDGKINRTSFMGTYEVVDGRPRNPMGRTGLSGRGALGRWGPNHAADPIVTRWKRTEKGSKVKHNKSGRPILEFVSILRGDCKEWAVPGGMVDPGEKVSVTLRREFGEEAMDSIKCSAEQKKVLAAAIEKLFANGVELYSGYVDDPRNTDNCWMETVAVNFHDDSGDSVGKIELTAGDDAVGVQWKEVGSDMVLYASHKKFLEEAAKLHAAHW